MYTFMDTLSHYIANIIRLVVKPEIVTVKDPSGLLRNDIKHLERTFAPPRYKSNMTLEEIALREGRYQVVEYIRDNMTRGHNGTIR